MEKIVKFNELISDYIGPNKTIIHANASNLMIAGENNMSDILRIHLTLKNISTDLEETDFLIAKLTINNPIVSEGSTARLTRNEYIFYKEILPKIQDFEQKHGLAVSNFFPRFLAGRINLNGSIIPNEDGVIVLEDLSLKGFRSGDRLLGFDLDATKLILNDLAKFHAVPLAMRLLDPKKYEFEIKNNCEGFISNVFEVSNIDIMKIATNMLNLVEKVINSEQNYCYVLPKFHLFAKRIRKMIERNPEQFFGTKVFDAFETLTHSDLWTNNILQKYATGTVVENVFLDFQMIESNTLVSDLIFFLTTSVEISCLKKEFNQLIGFYYEKLRGFLEKLECLRPENTYEKFLEALQNGAQPTIYQSIFMLIAVITVPKGKQFNPLEINELKLEDVPEIARERICFILQEAFQRGWLDPNLDIIV